MTSLAEEVADVSVDAQLEPVHHSPGKGRGACPPNGDPGHSERERGRHVLVGLQG